MFAELAPSIESRLDSVPPVRFSFCPRFASRVLLFPVMRLDCVVLSESCVEILSDNVALSPLCLVSRLPTRAFVDVRLLLNVLLLPVIRFDCVVLSSVAPAPLVSMQKSPSVPPVIMPHEMPAETLKEPCTKSVLDGFVVLIPTRPDPFT